MVAIIPIFMMPFPVVPWRPKVRACMRSSMGMVFEAMGMPVMLAIVMTGIVRIVVPRSIMSAMKVVTMPVMARITVVIPRATKIEVNTSMTPNGCMNTKIDVNPAKLYRRGGIKRGDKGAFGLNFHLVCKAGFNVRA